MKSFYCICICAALIATGATAQESDRKMAVVNMSELLRNYEKAARAEAQLEEQATEFREEHEAMRAKLKALNGEYVKLRRAARDEALSEAAREKRRDEAVQKLTAVKTYEGEIIKRAREIERSMARQNRRVREKLVEELRGVVRDYSLRKGYTMVIDSLTVVYAARSVENITADILKVVNIED
jgi:Skp family chaperone for outer membrane proteins